MTERAQGTEATNQEVVTDLIIHSAAGEEPAVIEPTEQAGVYDIKNGVLSTSFVRLGEVEGSSDTLPLDHC